MRNTFDAGRPAGTIAARRKAVVGSVDSIRRTGRLVRRATGREPDQCSVGGWCLTSDCVQGGFGQVWPRGCHLLLSATVSRWGATLHGTPPPGGESRPHRDTVAELYVYNDGSAAGYDFGMHWHEGRLALASRDARPRRRYALDVAGERAPYRYPG